MVDNGSDGDETGPETVSVGRSLREPDVNSCPLLCHGSDIYLECWSLLRLAQTLNAAADCCCCCCWCGRAAVSRKESLPLKWQNTETQLDGDGLWDKDSSMVFWLNIDISLFWHVRMCWGVCWDYSAPCVFLTHKTSCCSSLKDLIQTFSSFRSQTN